MQRLKCKQCGVEFEGYVSHNRKFCSHKCYSKFPHSKEQGENHSKFLIESGCLKGKNNPNYGKSPSKETIQKRLNTLDGRFKEIGKKIGETKKRLFKEGKLKVWNVGLTKEDDRVRKNIEGTAKTLKMKHSLGEISIWNKNLRGIHLSPTTEFKKGSVPWNKNLTKETSESVKRAAEKNSNLMGGKNFELYGAGFNEKLRRKVRQRDNYTCQECGVTEEELKVKEINYNKKLRVHHIDYCKKNNSESNLIALCLRCHLKTNRNREHWKKHFEMITFIRELFNPENILIWKDNTLIGVNKIPDSCKEEKNGDI